MLAQIAIMAGTYLFGIATQPRPKKVTFEEFLESNKGDETRPIPYIRGRWKTTPQRIWLGDFTSHAVERDSHWTDFAVGAVFGAAGVAVAAMFDFITVGYRYNCGQVLALTWGPINRAHQVYVQDLPCAVAPTSDNAGGTLLLDDPQLFGGDQPKGGSGLGGIYAVCDVVPGNYTQGRNAYLASVENSPPALRGIAALVVRGETGNPGSGYFAANSAQLREWKVEVMAWPDLMGIGFNRLPNDSFNRGLALYEWITNVGDYGAGYPAEHIHHESWAAAVEQLYEEGQGFSGEINTGGRAGDVIKELRASVDAEIYEHPSDGLKIKLVRKDYSIPSVTVLDESNVRSVDEYTPGDYYDTDNKVTVPFVNYENNYQPRPATYQDPANYYVQQRVSPREVTYPGVASAELAQKYATRDGRALGQPRPPLELEANNDARELWPGEVYKFEWARPAIEKFFRVHKRTPAEAGAERRFRLVSTEDQYSTGLSVFGAPTGTGSTDPVAGFATAPPAAEWDEDNYPPDGLTLRRTEGDGDSIQTAIVGGIQFGSYAPGGQYARVYLTHTPAGGPAGTQSLTPVRLAPDGDGRAVLVWPVGAEGTYQFCVETYSLTGATNGTKVCATIEVTFVDELPSLLTETGDFILTEDGGRIDLE